MRLFGGLSFLFGAAALVAAASDADTEEEVQTKENTYFNGQKVPPMLELTPKTWDQEVNSTKWMMVKHYR